MDADQNKARVFLEAQHICLSRKCASYIYNLLFWTTSIATTSLSQSGQDFWFRRRWGSCGHRNLMYRRRRILSLLWTNSRLRRRPVTFPCKSQQCLCLWIRKAREPHSMHDMILVVSFGSSVLCKCLQMILHNSLTLMILSYFHRETTSSVFPGDGRLTA